MTMTMIMIMIMTLTMTMTMRLIKVTYLAKACSSTAGFSERNDRNKLAVRFNATFVGIIFIEFYKCFIDFCQTKERKSSSCAIWRPMWLNPKQEKVITVYMLWRILAKICYALFKQYIQYFEVLLQT